MGGFTIERKEEWKFSKNYVAYSILAAREGGVLFWHLSLKSVFFFYWRTSNLRAPFGCDLWPVFDWPGRTPELIMNFVWMSDKDRGVWKSSSSSSSSSNVFILDFMTSSGVVSQESFSPVFVQRRGVIKIYIPSLLYTNNGKWMKQDTGQTHYLQTFSLNLNTK